MKRDRRMTNLRQKARCPFKRCFCFYLLYLDMKYLLFFIGGGLFMILASYSTPEMYSCKEDVKRLTAENDSLILLVRQSQEIAEASRKLAEIAEVQAVKASREAAEAAETQRLIADRSQEEALIQAERAVQATAEATRQVAIANELKRQLEACRKKN